MLQLDTQVLVIGAGPAGSVAAAVLARSGLDVLLVDRATFPRAKVCGDALTGEAVEALEQAGLLDAVMALPPHRVRGSRHWRITGASHAASAAHDHEFPCLGLVVPRVRLDDCLRQQAIRAGARCLHQCRLTSLVPAHDGRSGVAAGTLRDSAIRIRAPLTIVATGGPASLAEQWVAPGPGSLAVGARTYYDGVQSDEHWLEFHHAEGTESGYAWMFPLGEGRANVGYWAYQDDLQRRNLKLADLWPLYNRMPSLSRRLEGARPIAAFRAAPIWTGLGGAIVRDGTVYVGTAACAVDPGSGEGIRWAIESGYLAAAAAAAAVNAGDTSAAALLPYQTTMWERTRRWSQRITDDGRPVDRHSNV